jgi:hypothetical protein
MLRVFTIFAISILVSVGLFEFFGYSFYRDRLRSDVWTDLGTDGLKHIPNVSGKFHNFEMSYSVSINADGYRDNIEKKSLTAKDWIVLGDSFTFGVGVDFHEIWHQLLEDHTGVQLYNAGIASTQVHQFIKNYDTNLSMANHQGVLMSFFSRNDFVSVDSPHKFDVSDERNFDYYLWRLLVFLGSKSITYNVLLSAWKDRERPVDPTLEGADIPLEHINYTCKQITGFSEKLAKHGKRFILAIIPDDSMILLSPPERSLYWKSIEEMTQCLKSKNIDVIDPSLSMVASEMHERKKLYFNVDRHFSKFGNMIYAQKLIDQGLLRYTGVSK